MPHHLKRGDRLLIAALAAALALGGAALVLQTARTDAHGRLDLVCQTKDGQTIRKNLGADTTFRVKTPNAENPRSDSPSVNVIRIQNGTAFMEESTCKNQVCVEHAPISRAGQTIVCLPHGLVLEVVEVGHDPSPLL